MVSERRQAGINERRDGKTEDEKRGKNDFRYASIIILEDEGKNVRDLSSRGYQKFRGIDQDKTKENIESLQCH
jgi:hypothetical protein